MTMLIARDAEEKLNLHGMTVPSIKRKIPTPSGLASIVFGAFKNDCSKITNAENANTRFTCSFRSTRKMMRHAAVMKTNVKTLWTDKVFPNISVNGTMVKG